MGQPGMRVTLDAAMRARDVSRSDLDPAPAVPESAPPASDPRSSGDAEHAPMQQRSEPDARPQRDRRGSKAERRRLSKRHARARR
jgi:hypothetical protein